MKPVLSVIVPAYNEEAVLLPAFERLQAVMRGLGEPYEMIFINDGSRDATGEMLRTLARENEQVRVLHFSRNFGHQIAVTAGLDAAQGDAIVIIDADLQDPPEVIPEMVSKWREGYDVVYGKRKKRAGETAFKKLTAWGYYRVLQGLTGFDIPADAGDFRLVSRKAADAVRAMPEHNRFLRGIFAWVGFRQTEVVFERDRRFAGETKYTLKKMLRLAFDGILSFSTKPLTWMLALGLLLLLGGGIWLLALLIRVIIGHTGMGIAALGGMGMALCGLTIACMGILGAYMGRIYDEAKGRPLYFVAEKNGYQPEHSDE